MATEFIQKVLDETRGQERSVSWFRKKIKEFGAPSSTDLVREGERARTPFFGRLNMFFYSPKYKDKLPEAGEGKLDISLSLVIIN